nr:MAG TPA: hypothetical protein [Caudoviricetes sp.]
MTQRKQRKLMKSFLISWFQNENLEIRILKD